jgi:hypothetical protein
MQFFHVLANLYAVSGHFQIGRMHFLHAFLASFQLLGSLVVQCKHTCMRYHFLNGIGTKRGDPFSRSHFFFVERGSHFMKPAAAASKKRTVVAIESAPLHAFLRDNVISNVHIVDQFGLSCVWVRDHVARVMPLNVLSKELISSGWQAIADACALHLPLRYQTELAEQLRDMINNAYPKALDPKLQPLCVLTHCINVRENKLAPACAQHTCPCCVKHVEPKWQKTHRVLCADEGIFLKDMVHLIALVDVMDNRSPHYREAARITHLCAREKNIDLVCPGDLQPCASTWEGSVLYSSRECRKTSLPHVKGAHVPLEAVLCEKCVVENRCKFAIGHFIDFGNPERRAARVCDNNECNEGQQCPACAKWWFDRPQFERIPGSRGNEFSRKPRVLCGTCEKERIACVTCRRVSWKQVPGVFFSPNWVLGRPLWPSDCMHHCIFCLSYAERPRGMPKLEFQAQQQAALLICLRIRARAEKAAFDAAFEVSPVDAVRNYLSPHLSEREHALAKAHPELFWNLVSADCTLWNSTWWLIFQMIQLPKDVFLMIMRILVRITRGGPSVPSKKKEKPVKGGVRKDG